MKILRIALALVFAASASAQTQVTIQNQTKRLQSTVPFIVFPPTAIRQDGATIVTLKAITVSAAMDGQQVEVSGYTTTGDGGGGLFQYSSSSSATDNGGTIIAPTAGSGRWLRIDWDFDVRGFGASSSLTAAQNATKIQAAIDASDAGQLVYATPDIIYNAASLNLNGRRISNYAKAKYVAGVTWSGASLNARMTVSNNLLFVCEYAAANVAIFSINKASQPVLVHRFNVSANPRDVRVVGRFLFVACYGADKVEVYDLSILESPSLAYTLATGAGPKTIEIVGNQLFVACYGANSFRRYSITQLNANGVAISSNGTVAMTGIIDNEYDPQRSVFCVTELGDSFYQVSSIGFSTVSTVTVAGKQFSTAKYIGNRLYVAERTEGKIYVYDPTFNAEALITTITVTTPPEQMFRVGNFLYVAQLSNSPTTAKLDVLDVSAPDSPYLVQSTTLGVSGAGFIAYSDGYLYVSGHFSPYNVDVVGVMAGSIDPYNRAVLVDDNGGLFFGAHSGTFSGTISAATGTFAGSTSQAWATTSRTSLTNITTDTSDYLVRSGLGATFTLHDPASRLGQMMILYNASGSPVATTNGFAGWSGNVPATGSVVIVSSTYLGTAQWDLVSSQ